MHRFLDCLLAATFLVFGVTIAGLLIGKLLFFLGLTPLLMMSLMGASLLTGFVLYVSGFGKSEASNNKDPHCD